MTKQLCRLPSSAIGFILSAATGISLTSTARAGIIYVDSTSTLKTDLRNNDLYIGLHANNVVATVADGAQINGDQFTGGMRGFGNSHIDVVGGAVAGIDVLTNSVVHVSGGTVTTISDYTSALISGGTVTNLNILNISNSSYNSVGHATISGGTITQITNGYTGTASMTGGFLTGYLANSNISTFNLSGGTIAATLYSLDQYNTINLYGSGLSLLNPVQGASKDVKGYTGTYYDLIGTLSDGTAINTKYFSTGSLGTSRINLFNTATAPEPASLLLLALPAAGFVRRRRQAESNGQERGH